MATSITLNFDNLGSLDEYAPLGMKFSDNAGIWTDGSQSVFVNPDGGAYSVPSALMFGNAGGVLGSVYFDFEIDSIVIWALSGPGSDLLNNPMYVKAFDSTGSQIGEDNVDQSLQFDLLSISALGIRRLDLFSPIPLNVVWDDLTLTFDESPSPSAIPEPATMLLFGTGIVAMALARIRRKK